MTNNNLVSIIIPVYNVKEYLESCVQSALSQTYVNTEIILVDDGSTDGSSLLCDAIEKIDNRIKVYHKDNGGLSDARNYGVKKSTGAYIMFLDSDDLLEESIVEYLHNNITLCSAEISVCNYVRFVDEKDVNYSRIGRVEKLDTESALVSFLYQQKISTSACAKLYKRNILMKNQFVKGQRFEDNDFLYRVINSCSCISYADVALYGYRIRKSSITTSIFSRNDFDIIEIGRRILEDCEKINEVIKRAAESYQCSNCVRVLLTATNEYYEDDEYQYCIRYIKENCYNVFKDGNTRVELKVFLALYKIGFPLGLLKKIRDIRTKWTN